MPSLRRVAHRDSVNASILIMLVAIAITASVAWHTDGIARNLLIQIKVPLAPQRLDCSRAISFVKKLRLSAYCV
jgi:hypothetical protein